MATSNANASTVQAQAAQAAQAAALAQNAQSSANIITALGNAFKAQSGGDVSSQQIAQLLISNMGQLSELAKQGKLNQSHILQLKEYADKHKVASGSGVPIQPPSNSATVPAKAATATSMSDQNGIKSGSPAPILSALAGEGYYIAPTLSTTNPGPVQWPSAQQGRPTLTGGITAGRISGTPAQIARGFDEVVNLDDSRTRRKNTPGDQSMRRSIQDLVASVDPNVKIEPEVEDLLLNIADEFIDSVTNFGCRLAKHRGGDTLEVRDLQLHLERNHNIRIPGFAADETRLSLSQASVTPTAAPAGGKKGAQGTQMTLRSHRVAQVQQAKREAKLV